MARHFTIAGVERSHNVSPVVATIFTWIFSMAIPFLPELNNVPRIFVDHFERIEVARGVILFTSWLISVMTAGLSGNIISIHWGTIRVYAQSSGLTI